MENQKPTRQPVTTTPNNTQPQPIMHRQFGEKIIHPLHPLPDAKQESPASVQPSEPWPGNIDTNFFYPSPGPNNDESTPDLTQFDERDPGAATLAFSSKSFLVLMVVGLFSAATAVYCFIHII